MQGFLIKFFKLDKPKSKVQKFGISNNIFNNAKTIKKFKKRRKKVLLRKKREERVQYRYFSHKYQYNNKKKKKNLVKIMVSKILATFFIKIEIIKTIILITI